jgi:hypothetical protein
MKMNEYWGNEWLLMSLNEWILVEWMIIDEFEWMNIGGMNDYWWGWMNECSMTECWVFVIQEVPLHYLYGVWGSAFTILFKRWVILN